MSKKLPYVYAEPVDTIKMSPRVARNIVENLIVNGKRLPTKCTRHDVFVSNDHTAIYVDEYYAYWFLILIIPFAPFLFLYSLVMVGIGETIEGFQQVFLQKKYGSFKRDRYTALYGVNVKKVMSRAGVDV